MRFYGTNGNNRLLGTAGDDIFYASAGNDLFVGGGGNDTASYAGWNGPVTVMLGMNGGDGGAIKNVFQWIMGTRYTWYNSSDTLRDIDNVIGSQFDDTITGNEQDNILTGLGGRDTLNGGDGFDTADYSASDAGVTVNLSTGFGFCGHAEGDRYQSIERVIGSSYRDNLMGNSGVNKLQGMGDRDYLNGLEGGDTLDGGEGIDTASYMLSPVGVTVNLTTNQNFGGHAAGDILMSIENVEGSNYSDTLTGDAGTNMLYGMGLDDRLAGRGGSDHLDGGDGEDTADYRDSPDGVVVNLSSNTGQGGDAAGDTFASIENVNGSYYSDTLTGDAGDNRLEGFDSDDVLEGRAGADELRGGEGIDTADYSSSVSVSLQGVTVDLSTGEGSGDDAEGDSYLSIENVIGSLYEDVLIGNDEANVLDGRQNADTFAGLGGADTLIGGDDFPSDTADYSASPDGVTVNLESNVNRYGHAEGDKLFGIERVTGSKDDDRITGNGDGNLLYGWDGADTLDGGQGSDILLGGEGEDTLVGRLGGDILEGGGQADVFGYSSVEESIYAFDQFGAPEFDQIIGFETGVDTLHLQKIDANVHADGDQAFTVVQEFTGRGAELVITAPIDTPYGDISMLLGDVDGDAQADFAIQFAGELPPGGQAWITQFDILL